MKGVEHDLDLVVVVNVFPSRHARAHFRRIVEAHKRDVQVFLVVAEVSFRGFRNRFRIVRIPLGELRDLRHPHRRVALRLHG
jgi:hypothetical protein